MWARWLIPILALSCAGFTIVTDEMIEERERLCEGVRKRYTEEALSAFVRSVTLSHPQVEGIVLSESKVTEEWKTLDWNPFWFMESGDWALKVHRTKFLWFTRKDEFSMSWTYEEGWAIVLEGHRTRSGDLVLDSIAREEMIELSWL